MKSSSFISFSQKTNSEYVYDKVVRPLWAKYSGLMIGNHHLSPLYNSRLSDKTWAETWNGVRRAMRWLEDPVSIVLVYCRWTSIPSEWLVRCLSLSCSVVVPFLNLVKMRIHELIDELPNESRYYVDLAYLAGYPKMEDRELTDDPVKWLSTPSISEFSRNWWCEKFIQTFGENIKQTPILTESLESFALSRWKWVTDGATNRSKLFLGDQYIRTKLGAAVSLTDDEILQEVRNALDPKEKDMIGIFIKGNERGYKRRLIANVPLGAYIIASYVRYSLQEWVGDDPKYMKLSPSISDELDLYSCIREGKQAMPLDESAYDYHVSKQSWLGFFDFLDTFNNPGLSCLRTYYEKAYWIQGTAKGKWMSGMPSGLALTSYLNSWMNYIKQKAIVPGLLQWAAGDDVLVYPYEHQSLQKVAEQYARFGSEVNVSKNWLSSKFAEYLKVLYGDQGSTGYPARIFSSLLWAEVDRPFLPEDKLAELAELWKQFFDRLGLPFDEALVARDLSRAVSYKVQGFNMILARKWLHCPKVHGGFGRLPYNNCSFTWQHDVVNEVEYKGAKIRLPRVVRYGNKHSLVLNTAPVKITSFRTGPPLRLKAVTTMSEWEDRMNGLDNPLKGPFRTMALDIIPLPTLDFVSTAKMSAFAKSIGYNVYPNVRGSYQRIADRLVTASLSLVERIGIFMNNNRLTTWC